METSFFSNKKPKNLSKQHKVNFTNVLQAAFTCAEKMRKKYIQSSLGSERVKAARKKLIKLTPDFPKTL